MATLKNSFLVISFFVAPFLSGADQTKDEPRFNFNLNDTSSAATRLSRATGKAVSCNNPGFDFNTSANWQLAMVSYVGYTGNVLSNTNSYSDEDHQLNREQQ
jgi:hypothetical protein